LTKRPIEFRDKTICNLKSDELTEVSVTHDKDSFTLAKQGSAWKATSPRASPQMIPRFRPLPAHLQIGKARLCRGQLAQGHRLVKPSATIATKSNVKGHGCLLKVGSETSDKGNYFVQANGQPDIFTVPKWSVDRVLVKLDDLKKK